MYTTNEIIQFCFGGSQLFYNGDILSFGVTVAF